MLVVLDINGVLCETATRRRAYHYGVEAACQARKKLVFLRPSLSQFLEFLFANYEVAVWTSCPYFSAMPLVEAIFTPMQIAQLQFIFTRVNCELMRNYGSRKNLQAIWQLYPRYNAQNTLLLDDDAAKIVQLENWIEVPKYIATTDNSKNDTVLVDIINHLSNQQ